MKFNKSLLSAALLLGLGVATSASASAPGGTVSITGKIIPDTCKVSINGGTAVNTLNATGSVILSPVTTNQINTAFGAAPGKPYSPADFTLVYSGCTDIQGGYSIQPDFAGAGNNFDSTSKTLANGGTAGTNVGVGITQQGSSTLLDLNNAAAVSSKPMVSGGATFNLSAAYVPLGIVSAGTVSATAAFTTTYI